MPLADHFGKCLDCRCRLLPLWGRLHMWCLKCGKKYGQKTVPMWRMPEDTKEMLEERKMAKVMCARLRELLER